MTYDRLGRVNHIRESDSEVPQKIAEALWAVATSDVHGIADGRGTVYRTLELALNDALFWVYKLTDPEAEHARDLLSEYGPDDSLTGTDKRGIQSYAVFALLNPRRKSY